MSDDFRPALVVVDLQEDFCPPNGSLAVAGGRDIIPIINSLLKLPFILKVATKDHHPPNHVSFASNHEGKQPFISDVVITNPLNPAEMYETRLWPPHCVIGTPGNELVEELDQREVKIVLKGMDPRVEMYSAVTSPFRNPKVPEATSELEELLKAENVSDLYFVGLTGDYCVRYTAMDCAKLQKGNEGKMYGVYVIEDAVRNVDPGEGWMQAKRDMESSGIQIIGFQDANLERVRKLNE